MEGWIKIHRKLLMNAVFYKADYFQVWMYILLNVNHETRKMIWNNESKTIEKGSGIFSQKKISSELKIPIGTVNNILKFLKAESQIEIKSTPKFTEIKVIMWSEYQEAETISENKLKTERKQNENRMKTNRKQNETNKNEKNEENDKNVKNEEKEGEIVFPFSSDQFLTMWTNWKTFKLESFKFKYDSKISEQAALKKISQLSEGNELKAIAIIEQSIERKWQGFFPLKENGQTSKTGKPNTDKLDQVIDAMFGAKQ
jgi:hypothetical protein